MSGTSEVSEARARLIGAAYAVAASGENLERGEVRPLGRRVPRRLRRLRAACRRQQMAEIETAARRLCDAVRSDRAETLRTPATWLFTAEVTTLGVAVRALDVARGKA